MLNAGSIRGAVDIQLTSGGYVSNSSTGVLLTTNPSYGHGIELNGGNATVVNAGQITATYAGIYSRGASSLNIRNSGTIIGASVASSYSAGIAGFMARRAGSPSRTAALSGAPRA